jgi:type IV secretion system protein VirB4
VLDALLKIPANFYVVTEWTPLPGDKARKEVNKRRRHFNMSKTGFVSQMGNDATKTNPRDVLVDESKQADIENLGDCLRAMGDGQSLGDFSLTIVLYGRSRPDIDQLVAEFTGVFTNADGNLFAETYNQLNAYFATVPGNYAMNLRQLYMLNTNYADLSFLFTILPGEKTNEHLGTEYWAVLETDNSTPYFLNLHTRDVAHTLILGMTGSGNSYLRKYAPPSARANSNGAEIARLTKHPISSALPRSLGDFDVGYRSAIILPCAGDIGYPEGKNCANASTPTASMTTPRAITLHRRSQCYRSVRSLPVHAGTSQP